MAWKDVASRAARTFLQAFVGVFLAATVTSDLFAVPDFDTLKRAGLAAAWAGAVALLSFVQNLLEDLGALPSILGKQGPPDQRAITSRGY